MEKLKCVKTVNAETLKVRRISESEAAVYVASGLWRYTSKSAYKKFIKDSIPKYSAGKFGSSRKRFKSRTASSTKRALERVQHIKVTTTHTVGPLVLHESLRYKVTVDPILGTYTTSKQGKGSIIPSCEDNRIIGRTYDKVIRHSTAR